MALRDKTIIEEATVIGVDPETYTLTISTAESTHSGVQWASPYSHQYKGQGSYCMPEIGSMCLVLWTVVDPITGVSGSFKIDPIVIGFYLPAKFEEGGEPVKQSSGPMELEDCTISGDEEEIGDPSYRNKREKIIPGDIVCGKTSSGNKVILYTGGVTQVHATDICQRLYISVDNWIRDFCQNYIMACDGGYVKWHDDIETGTGNPVLKTTLEHHIRADGDDKINRCINIWRGNEGNLIKMVITGEKDLPLSDIDQSFKESAGVYASMGKDNKYVTPKSLDLLRPGGTEKPVVGYHVSDTGEISLVNRDHANFATEGDVNAFIDKDLNLTIKKDARISICHEDNPHHKIAIHAKNTGGGRLYMYVKGDGSGAEAFDVRVGNGDIQHVVKSSGNIREQTTTGSITRDVITKGNIRDQTRMGNLNRSAMIIGNIRDQTLTGNLTRQSALKGDIKDEVMIGDITRSTSVGEIKDQSTVGDISRTSIIGDIKDTAVIGDINTQAILGRININSMLGVFINCIPTTPSTPVLPIKTTIK